MTSKRSLLAVSIAVLLGSAHANDTTTQTIDNVGTQNVDVQDFLGTLSNSFENLAFEGADQQAVALDYWTPEMIATAPAMEMPVDTGMGGVDVFALDEEVITGPAGEVDAGKARRWSNRFHRRAYSENWMDSKKDWGAFYQDSLGSTVLCFELQKN